ncbi:hypothetical protein ACEQPO_04410 [Bacillus sp. SL00103]
MKSKITSDLKNEEPSIDQKRAKSRLSRSAAKRGRTSKAKAASDDERSTIQRIFAKV